MDSPSKSRPLSKFRDENIVALVLDGCSSCAQCFLGSPTDVPPQDVGLLHHTLSSIGICNVTCCDNVARLLSCLQGSSSAPSTDSSRSSKKSNDDGNRTAARHYQESPSTKSKHRARRRSRNRARSRQLSNVPSNFSTRQNLSWEIGNVINEEDTENFKDADLSRDKRAAARALFSPTPKITEGDATEALSFPENNSHSEPVDTLAFNENVSKIVTQSSSRPSRSSSAKKASSQNLCIRIVFCDIDNTPADECKPFFEEMRKSGEYDSVFTVKLYDSSKQESDSKTQFFFQKFDKSLQKPLTQEAVESICVSFVKRSHSTLSANANKTDKANLETKGSVPNQRRLSRKSTVATESLATPLDSMTEALSSLLHEDGVLTGRARSRLEVILRALNASRNIYRPSFEDVLRQRTVDRESRNWVAREFLLQAVGYDTSDSLRKDANRKRFQRNSAPGVFADWTGALPAQTLAASNNVFSPMPEEESLEKIVIPSTFPCAERIVTLRSWSFNVFDSSEQDLVSDIANMFVDLGLLDHMNITVLQFFAFLSNVARLYDSHPNPYHNFRHAFDVTQAGYLFLRDVAEHNAALASNSITLADNALRRASSPIFTTPNKFKQRSACGSPKSSPAPRLTPPRREMTYTQNSESLRKQTLGSPSKSRQEATCCDFTLTEKFALLLACVCHDLDHDGRSNTFHIQTGSHLALLYNDQSPQENNHARRTFELISKYDLLSKPSFYGKSSTDLTSNASSQEELADSVLKQYHSVRGIIIRCILATDLGQHVDVLARFNEILPSFDWSDQVHRLRALEMLMKCADVSNVLRPRELAAAWSDAIQQEMFAQGDEERMLGLPVSAFSDREQPQSARLGLTFADFMCMPLYRYMGVALAPLGKYLAKIADMREYWMSVIELNQGGELQDCESNYDANSHAGSRSNSPT